MRTYDFDGHAITFVRHGTRWWTTARALAPGLGFDEPGPVHDLYRRQKGRFDDGVTTLKIQRPQPRRLFSVEGAILLSRLGREPVAERFHEWLHGVKAGLSSEHAQGHGQSCDLIRQWLRLQQTCERLLGLTENLADQLKEERQLNRELLDVLVAHLEVDSLVGVDPGLN